MAHQASRIPWELLASPLEWRSAVRGKEPDLRAHLKPESTAVSDLNGFADAFLDALSSDAISRYSAGSQTDTLSGENDVILDDDVVGRISATVQRIASGLLSKCFGDRYKGCRDAIPPRQRKASAFQQPKLINRCGEFFYANGPDFYNLEVFKILLLRGEMDAVLRICRLPDPWAMMRWKQGECTCSLQPCPHGGCKCDGCSCDREFLIGWNHVFSTTLLAYLALNLFLSMPETWGRDRHVQEGRRHYRDTMIYQNMLLQCTTSGFLSEAPRHYHRQFFGVTRGQFNKDRPVVGWWAVVGMLPIEGLLARDGPVGHVPTAGDVRNVQLALRSWGLPTELVLLVMEMADYSPQRRLEVPDDPLHPENRRELEGYLDWCWDVLVRCFAAKRACGDSPSEVWALGEGLADLLGLPVRSYYENGRVRFSAQ